MSRRKSPLTEKHKAVMVSASTHRLIAELQKAKFESTGETISKAKCVDAGLKMLYIRWVPL